MNLEAVHIIEQLSREKGIEKTVLINALKLAVEAAARKRLPEIKNIHSEFNESTGDVEIYAEKTVVEKVEKSENEISLKEVAKIAPDAQLGETVLVHQTLENYGRIAAQLAKQVILQKVREAEIENIYNEYQDKKTQLVNGMVQRFEHGDIIVDLGKVEGILPRREQVFRESFNRGERIRAYVLDVKKTPKNALVILSRTQVGLIRRLFEMEVPEISEGMVEIMGIVREPSGRTKIAVKTNDRDIDPVGACVGMRGLRVQSIVQELRGEKIDIVQFSEDPQVFVRNALNPAKISRIIQDPENQHMTIIVADDQMSLAIGKKGQNVRLAAKLVKWKIDIKGESESGGVLDSHSLVFKQPAQEVDFTETVTSTKGLGEKIATILTGNGLSSFQEVVEKGAKGLTELPGIGPKKAEAIFSLAQEQIEKSPAPTLEKPPAEVSGEPETVELKDSLEATQEEAVAEEVEEVEKEEDAEIPVQELVNIDANIIGILEENGFQTLAELSITPLEELVAIEGIEEDIAKTILEQAKQRVNNFEKA